MISADSVFAQIGSLMTLDTEASERMRYFCNVAAETMTRRLKPDADASDSRLILATAALAQLRYLQMLSDDESDMVSIRAGDVTIRRDAETVLKRAEQFCRETLSDVNDLLADTSFIFATI